MCTKSHTAQLFGDISDPSLKMKARTYSPLKEQLPCICYASAEVCLKYPTLIMFPWSRGKCEINKNKHHFHPLLSGKQSCADQGDDRLAAKVPFFLSYVLQGHLGNPK